MFQQFTGSRGPAPRSGSVPAPRRRGRPGRRYVAGLGAVTGVLLLVAGCGEGGIGGKEEPKKPAVVTVAAEHAAPLNPAAPIEVDVADGTLTAVDVVNPGENGKKVAGEIAPDGHSWHSTEPLAYDAAYSVTADATGEDGAPVHRTATVHTLAPKDTAYANSIPAPEYVADTGVGVGLPVTIQFRKPVTDRAAVQKALQVTTDPPVEGAWYWIDDENVHYRPEHYWKPGTKIHVTGKLYGLDLGDGVYGAEDLDAAYTVHDALIAHADGNTEQLSIERNGTPVGTYPMSMGDPTTPTHSGTHVISEKAPVVTMDSCSYGVCQGQSGYYRETVYNDLRISNDGEFIHNAPWSVGSQGASNVSHGCINLSPANSEEVYGTLGIGDVVEVSNSGGDPLPVWDVYGDWGVPWETWKAGNVGG